MNTTQQALWPEASIPPIASQKITASKRKRLIFETLTAGGSIVDARSSGFRLRNDQGVPIAKLRKRTFYKVRELLRPKGQGHWVLSVLDVKRLHGNRLEKRIYKSQKNKIK